MHGYAARPACAPVQVYIRPIIRKCRCPFIGVFAHFSPLHMYAKGETCNFPLPAGCRGCMCIRSEGAASSTPSPFRRGAGAMVPPSRHDARKPDAARVVVASVPPGACRSVRPGGGERRAKSLPGRGLLAGAPPQRGASGRGGGYLRGVHPTPRSPRAAGAARAALDTPWHMPPGKNFWSILARFVIGTARKIRSDSGLSPLADTSRARDEPTPPATRPVRSR